MRKFLRDGTLGINRSVRRKVLVVVLVTTFVALLVSAGALLTYEARNYREFLFSDVTTQADILARTSAPAVAFDDFASAEATLAMLSSRPGITAAAVYDEAGELFASYRKDGHDEPLPEHGRPRGPAVENGALTLFHPIVENNQLLGTVYLRAQYELADRVVDHLLILGAVMLGSLLVATAVSLWLQGTVTHPILAVTDVAQRVVKDRDFDLRATRTTRDEIGTLVDAFNAMLTEVSERQRALEESNRRLKKETEERRNAEISLRLADKHKDEFLATLAHELRNPLAPMVNALTLLRSPGTAPETAQRAKEIIDRQLTHMIRLVDDLLDVSRISRGKLTIRREPMELSSVIQNAVDTVRPLVEREQQVLTVEVPDRPVYMHADPVRLSQVFANLLNNASRYTQAGGRIDLSAVVQGNSVCIRVRDNGKGIAGEDLPHIFAMFTQQQEAAVRVQAGLGVGLALARRLVELHGGSIEAESEGPGCGSTFTVRLPVKAALTGGTDGIRTRPGREPVASGARILLVDDNVDFATTLAFLLEQLGHEVRVAHDAAGALAAAAEFRPNFAFLDIGLPVVDGYELARRLHDLLKSDIPLVAISGWGQEEDRRRAREAGFASYLVKPVGLDSIRSTLDSLGTRRG
ncbi:MAG TPA: ATP-binding protein [Woeseiaceae bacterium]|nr:ATP-binding protein [Woeseiaceae bacterium]